MIEKHDEDKLFELIDNITTAGSTEDYAKKMLELTDHCLVLGLKRKLTLLAKEVTNGND